MDAGPTPFNSGISCEIDLALAPYLGCCAALPTQAKCDKTVTERMLLWCASDYLDLFLACTSHTSMFRYHAFHTRRTFGMNKMGLSRITLFLILGLVLTLAVISPVAVMAQGPAGKHRQPNRVNRRRLNPHLLPLRRFSPLLRPTLQQLRFRRVRQYRPNRFQFRNQSRLFCLAPAWRLFPLPLPFDARRNSHNVGPYLIQRLGGLLNENSADRPTFFVSDTGTVQLFNDSA